jgi:protoporphyrinogen oxidase
MTTDLVGKSVFKPDIDDVRDGAKRNLGGQTHYIQGIRYPKTGGYQSFAQTMRSGANILIGLDVDRIDLSNKTLWANNGLEMTYDKLINTIPLPTFISLCADAPPEVVTAARQLYCSSVYLVNVATEHPTMRGEN